MKNFSIAEFTGLPVSRALMTARNWEFGTREMEIAGRLVDEIRRRLEFLSAVGLDYLGLDRSAATLSGGEAQRIRLATQIGSKLRGVLYVLDEPSIGLHPRDNQRLLDTLAELRDLGNTVVVVEHDAETIERADYVIDLGPGAGRLGGALVAAGPPEAIAANPESLTGQYLAGVLKIPVPLERRRPNGKKLVIVGAVEHNLKNMDVEIPLGVLTVVTGVSGSGKSTLINEILYRALAREIYGSREEPGKHDRIEGLENIDKVIRIDQSPIGRTPRSNPATYTGLFTPIRDLYAMLPESRERGYKPGRFSFNVKGGRCEACQGDGLKRIEMNFLPDVYVTCDVCRGAPLQPRNPAGEVQGLFHRRPAGRHRGGGAGGAGEHPADQGQAPDLARRRAWDTSTWASPPPRSPGGEAQRIKLARELSRRQTGRTLYMLDEPTTGLHFDDVRKLLDVLQRLVDLGNTVIVIEHNLDVIKTADWIIDLGPEGGEYGRLCGGCGRPRRNREAPQRPHRAGAQKSAKRCVGWIT